MKATMPCCFKTPWIQRVKGSSVAQPGFPCNVSNVSGMMTTWFFFKGSKVMSTLPLAGGQLMTHLFSLLHLVHLAARSAPSDKAYGTTSAPKQHVVYEMVWKSLCLERFAWLSVPRGGNQWCMPRLANPIHQMLPVPKWMELMDCWLVADRLRDQLQP